MHVLVLLYIGNTAVYMTANGSGIVSLNKIVLSLETSSRPNYNVGNLVAMHK